MSPESNGLKPPWAMSGWEAQVETWISTEMSRLRFPVIAIQPLRNWCISVVLRVETGSRPMFFKATLDLPLFVKEGSVMTSLAQLYPEYIPTPLAVDNHAVSYQFILNNLEEASRPEINMAHYFLRQVLAGLAALERK